VASFALSAAERGSLPYDLAWLATLPIGPTSTVDLGAAGSHRRSSHARGNYRTRLLWNHAPMMEPVLQERACWQAQRMDEPPSIPILSNSAISEPLSMDSIVDKSNSRPVTWTVRNNDFI